MPHSAVSDRLAHCGSVSADKGNSSLAFSKLLLCGLLLPANAALAKPLQPVTLQLKWLHQFQFAGYYAAKEKGFYEAAGLDVDIRPAQPDIHRSMQLR